MVKPEKNKSENQKTAELLRLMFKGKTVKTARPHKNRKRTTETAGARSEPPIRIVTAIAMFRQLRERRGTNSSILPAV
jgi:hypothetical protein